jgi:two-component system chemotaxis response regulator CheY
MKKVLIVDDSPMVLNIIETALSLEDYDVVRASNADEALKKMDDGKFDFGIFDVNMPGKTGIELVPLVLNHPNGKEMKIVILTTESSSEIRKKGEEAGACAWMVKPFKNAEMIDLLKQLEE